jgi:hypothetical protein
MPFLDCNRNQRSALLKVWRAYARATGRLVRKPNMMEEIPEMAAVAVIKSRCMPKFYLSVIIFLSVFKSALPNLQALYAISVEHVGS